MELIIFDCDGVLIDSELIACAADANALMEIGYDIPHSPSNRLISLS